MTEKRFTTMWKPETTFSRFWIARDNSEKMNANDVVECLNALHEENTALKQDNLKAFALLGTVRAYLRMGDTDEAIAKINKFEKEQLQ